MTYREKMELAVRAAYAAGAMLKQYRNLHIDRKSKNDYVTDADRASEKLIRGMVLGTCPEDGFYGEESGVEGGNKRGMWVVDPIDGTTNFIHHIPPYTISVGYMMDGQPVAGAVYAPLTDEMFCACKDGGAYLNGKPIRVSDTTDPQSCVLGMSFAHRNPECSARMFELIPRLLPKINDMRRLGSAAYDLCCVAAGRSEGFMELGLSLYDYAGGYVILTEAGGKLTGWESGEDGLKVGNILASNGVLHETFRKMLS